MFVGEILPNDNPAIGSASDQIVNRKYLILYRELAEVHGNRTHLSPCSDGTLDLKSRRATSALSTSAIASIPYSVGAGEEILLRQRIYLEIVS
jgi:hypothetical protein